MKELSASLGSLKDSYQRDGLAVIDFGFPESLLDEVSGFIQSRDGWDLPAEKINENRSRGLTGGRLQDAWKFNSAVKALAIFPQVLQTLQAFYGKKPLPFQTLNFPIGTQQPAHSDALHFNCWPNDGSMCGVWVALEDVDEENGALVYYPGSHKLPEIYPVNFNIPHSRDGGHLYNAQVSEKLGRFIDLLKIEPKRAILRKGQAVIWAANLLHGGSPIRDKKRSRMSQATHYYFEGSEFYWTPLLSDFLKGKLHKRTPEFIR